MDFKILALCTALFPLAVQASQTEHQRMLSTELTKAVAQINADTPKMLDEETRLDSAATFSNYIIYNNTMVNYTADQFDAATFDGAINDVVIAPLCTKPGLEGFIELGVIMVYRYHGNDGNYISELSKDMATCKSR